MLYACNRSVPETARVCRITHTQLGAGEDAVLLDGSKGSPAQAVVGEDAIRSHLSNLNREASLQTVMHWGLDLVTLGKENLRPLPMPTASQLTRQRHMCRCALGSTSCTMRCCWTCSCPSRHSPATMVPLMTSRSSSWTRRARMSRVRALKLVNLASILHRGWVDAVGQAAAV